MGQLRRYEAGLFDRLAAAACTRTIRRKPGRGDEAPCAQLTGQLQFSAGFSHRPCDSGDHPAEEAAPTGRLAVGMQLYLDSCVLIYALDGAEHQRRTVVRREA